MVIPPTNCTKYGVSPVTRFDASLTVANASTKISSKVSPLLMRSLKFLVCGGSNLISLNNKSQKSKFLFPFNLRFIDIEWKDLNDNYINFYGKPHSFLICFSYMEYQMLK